jgi:hypothetical protein
MSTERRETAAGPDEIQRRNRDDDVMDATNRRTDDDQM